MLSNICFLLLLYPTRYVQCTLFPAKVGERDIAIATLPPFGPIEGNKWFDQIPSQWVPEKPVWIHLFRQNPVTTPPPLWFLGGWGHTRLRERAWGVLNGLSVYMYFVRFTNVIFNCETFPHAILWEAGECLKYAQNSDWMSVLKQPWCAKNNALNSADGSC